MKHRIRFRVIHSAGKEEKLLINLGEGESFELNHELLGLKAMDANQPHLIEFRVVAGRAQITLKDTFFSLLLNGKSGSTFTLKPSDVMSINGSILEFLEVPLGAVSDGETRFVDIRTQKAEATPVVKAEPTFTSLVDFKPSAFHFDAPEPTYSGVDSTKKTTPQKLEAVTTSEPQTQSQAIQLHPNELAATQTGITRPLQAQTQAPSLPHSDFKLPSLEITAEITKPAISTRTDHQPPQFEEEPVEITEDSPPIAQPSVPSRPRFKIDKKKFIAMGVLGAAAIALAVLGPQYFQQIRIPSFGGSEPEIATAPVQAPVIARAPVTTQAPEVITQAPAVVTQVPVAPINLQNQIAALRNQVQKIQTPMRTTLSEQKPNEVAAVSVQAPIVDQAVAQSRPVNPIAMSTQKTPDLSDLRKLLFASVKEGNINQVRTFIDSGQVAVDAVDPNGRTALMGAAYFGKLSISQYLISKGAQVDIQDKNGDTALIHAIQNKNSNISGYLVTVGASPKKTNYKGQSASSLAKSSGNSALIASLQINSNRSIAAQPPASKPIKKETYRAVTNRIPAAVVKPVAAKPVARVQTSAKPITRAPAAIAAPSKSVKQFMDDDLPAPSLMDDDLPPPPPAKKSK